MRAQSFVWSAALALVALAGEASAQCASQSACPNPCTSCRVPPAMGSNPTSATMSMLFDRVAAGPTVYGSLGYDFAGRTTIGMGPGRCGRPGPAALIPAFFPCLLLKSIYYTESAWRQFCDSNRTVISFDCGYGIAQVTSGMRRGDTGTAYDPNRVASDPAYNVSVGAAILADKWRASPCVGDNDPHVIEHWYFATWGYNGFAFKNNPNNPMYRADRPEFRTPGVSSAQTRGNYPYQEVVWGYAHYPPSATHWTGLGLAYPTRSEICASCGLPSANISNPMGSHVTTCPASSGTDAGVADVVVRPDVVVMDVAPRPEAGPEPMPEPTREVAPEPAPDVAVAEDAAEDAVDDSSTAEDVVVVADVQRRDGAADGGGGGAMGTCGCAVPAQGRLRASHGVLLLGLGVAGALRKRRRERS